MAVKLRLKNYERLVAGQVKRGPPKCTAFFLDGKVAMHGFLESSQMMPPVCRQPSEALTVQGCLSCSKVTEARKFIFTMTKTRELPEPDNNKLPTCELLVMGDQDGNRTYEGCLRMEELGIDRPTAIPPDCASCNVPRRTRIEALKMNPGACP